MIYLLLSLATSIIGAISGIGGGVIIRPVLDALGTFDISVIAFLSGNTVLAMSLSALLRNLKTEINVNREVSIPLAIGAIVGGLGGKNLFDIIRIALNNDRNVGAIQSLILAGLTLAVFIFTLNKSRIVPFTFRKKSFSLATGLFLGSIASFLSIGGGPLNLALLYLLFSMDSKTAALNSLFIIFFSQLTSLIYTILSGNTPDFPVINLILMLAGGIIGGILGLQFSRKMTNRHIDTLFCAVMVVIIGVCLYNFFRYLG